MIDRQPQNELIEIITCEVERGAVMVGVNARGARDLAKAVAERIMIAAGGRQLYVPRRDAVSDRQACVMEFNGRNHAELCRRYGISRRTLRRWVDSARADARQVAKNK